MGEYRAVGAGEGGLGEMDFRRWSIEDRVGVEGGYGKLNSGEV